MAAEQTIEATIAATKSKAKPIAIEVYTAKIATFAAANSTAFIIGIAIGD